MHYRALVEAHANRLKYYADGSLDAKSILPNAISSETGMQIQRLLRLVDNADGLYVAIRLRGLPFSEDNLESLQQVYADFSRLIMRLLRRQVTNKNSGCQSAPCT